MTDLRQAVRTLLRQPTFTLVAVATLALGIGANTAIFTVVNAVLLRPLPYPDEERLVKIYSTRERQGLRRANLSPADFLDLKREASSFEALGANGWLGFTTLTGSGEPERLGGVLVTDGFFRALGVRPALGRLFQEADDRPGAPRVAVISHGLWQRRFGSNPDVLGRTVRLDAVPTTVIGVLPPEYRHIEPSPERTADVFRPFRFDPLEAGRGGHFIRGVGRLKRGVTPAEAQSELDVIASRLEREYPDSNTGKGVAIYPLKEEIVGDQRMALLLLLGAVGLVLLIACANLANLLLAGATGRGKEVAIRAALGADRIRLIRQLLTESLVLGVAGGAAGLALGSWLTRLLVSLAADTLPWPDRVAMDASVLAFTAAVAVGTALVFGAFPAVQLSATDLQDALKEGGRQAAAGSGRRARGFLIAAEVALSAVLLVGAALLLRSLWTLQATDPGFRTERVLSLDVSLPTATYEEGDQIPFYRELEERLQALPAVASIGAVNILPLSGNYSSDGFQIDVRPLPEPQSPSAEARSVTPGYFRTMGVPLLRGRGFDDRDTADSPGVVVVSETFAGRFFPGEDPLGMRITYNRGVPEEVQQTVGGPGSREIIGIVGDVKHLGLEQDNLPMFYTPHAQQPSYHTMSLVLRTEADEAQVAAQVRSEVQRADPNVPVYNIRPLDRLVSSATAAPRLRTLLLAGFAGLALLLSLVGVYGVVRYLVGQRSHEIGIRIALGARGSDVVRLLVREGMAPVVAGLALGLAAAVGLSRLLGAFLFEVTPGDPLTYAAVGALLGATALLASYLPARRAGRIDPLRALRGE